MSTNPFNDEATLAEQAEALGRQALKLSLIPSFFVHHFPDSWRFYISDFHEDEALTPEEAYLILKKTIDSANVK